MSILSLSDISLSIGEHAILRGITFDVTQGQVVGLIGPNGSGKTTLFNVISGFLKPTAGCIGFHGEDITNCGPSLRARKGIGRVFQNFGIFRDMTLLENVLVALEALPKEQRKAIGDLRNAARGTLHMVGLSSHESSKAGSLSGGQMRLLEIARTLTSGKELFLLDEPTAGVSPKMTGQVAELIGQLKQAGKTVIIIEHDLPFISRICDEVVVLDVGEVVMKGSPADVKKSKQLQEVYFGADPTS